MLTIECYIVIYSLLFWVVLSGIGSLKDVAENITFYGKQLIPSPSSFTLKFQILFIPNEYRKLEIKGGIP